MKTPLFAKLVLGAVLLSGTVVSEHFAAETVRTAPTRTKTRDDGAKTKMAPARAMKHALGVVDFENEQNFFSHIRMAENMRAMLESSLHATGRFVVVERGNIEAVLLEQDLQASDRAARANDAAQSGRLRSARFLAAGTITEAVEETSGDAGGINLRGVRLGGSRTRAHVVVVVKVVDSTTGEVVASERIRGEAGRTAVNVGYAGTTWSGDLGSFARTPIGEASQDCVNQAVKFIAARMADAPIEGAVVAVAGEQIIINLGENFGTSVGHSFRVRRDGEVLTDPVTGEVLDRLEGSITGTIEVTTVREKVAYCKLVDGTLPERGDRIILKD
jgi:curli biogenesis system outer membrane secretion channel CsgG